MGRNLGLGLQLCLGRLQLVLQGADLGRRLMQGLVRQNGVLHQGIGGVGARPQRIVDHAGGVRVLLTHLGVQKVRQKLGKKIALLRGHGSYRLVFLAALSPHAPDMAKARALGEGGEGLMTPN